MKHDWEYKKLGEVCTIERGGSPRPINNYITDDPNGVNWIKIGDAVDGSKYINSTKERIRPEGMKKSRFVHKGDFILSNSMSFGKPYILGVDGCIHDGWLVIHDDNDTFNKDFLYYYLGSPMMYRKFENLAVGGVVNNLNSQLVRSVSVPIPALAVQERIVAELDKVSEIIEKKKQQVKELDNLAQSIFYDMFGEILEATPTKCLKDVAEYFIGLTYSPSDVSENGHIVLRSSNIQNCALDFEDTVRVNMKISEKKFVHNGDILMCARNGSARLVGKVARINNLQETMSFGAFMTIIRSRYNDYLFHFFLSHFFRGQLTTSKTATINQITTKMLDGIKLNVPTIEQQQSFAQKIEVIEKQKELITASLKEAETLFDARMEYWFGE